MRAALVGLIALATLTCCSGLPRVQPPVRPSEDQIVTDYTTFTSKFGNISYPDYVRTGYRAVDANCDLFFERLAEASRSFSLLKRETVLGIATTSSILALLHNSAQTLAIMAASGALLSETVDNVQDYALLTRYTAQLKTYIDQARVTFKQTNDPTMARDMFAADDFVRQYANLCTIDGLEQTIAQSITNTVAVPQALATVEKDIQTDLKLSSLPALDDLRRLAILLDTQAVAARRQETTSGGKFAGAAGIYWYADKDPNKYQLKPLGITRQYEISQALAYAPPGASPATAPAPPTIITPALAPPGPHVPPPPPPPPSVAAPVPVVPGGRSYATPLINVPK